MSSTRHAFESLRRTHLALVDWLHALLVAASVPDVQVQARFGTNDAEAPQLVALPFQVRPSPKLTELKDDLPLMGGTGERRTVPEPWSRLGTQIADLMTTVFGAVDPRGRNRTMMPVSALPPSLAAWYRAREDDPGEAWVTPEGVARAPSLLWHRSLPLEAQYLIFSSEHLLPVEAGESGPVPFGLPALGAIFMGLQERTLISVKLPPHEVDPILLSFVEACIPSATPEVAAEMAAFIPWASHDQTRQLALHSMADTEGPTFDHLLRSLNRPFAMVASFSIQINVGGRPVFGPSGTPSVHTAQQER